MAVVSCNEKQELSGARYTLTGKEYTRGYVVILDDPADGASIAIQAAGLPDRLDEHPDDNDAKCVDLQPAMHETRLIWYVYATYRTPTRGTPGLNPLDDKVDIDWDAWVVSEAVWQDKDGAPILNSAYDLYDPAWEEDMHYLMVTVVRNELSYSPVTADYYLDSVNSDTTTIVGLPITARHAKLVKFSGRTAQRNTVDYWIVTYQVMFRPDYGTGAQTRVGWDTWLLDHGLRHLVSNQQVHIKGEDLAGEKGEDRISSPVRLDGSGSILEPANATPVFNDFKTKKERAFAALGLNITE